MTVLTTAEGWIALLTLTVLEIVLGIDNIIFISILAGKLPKDQRERARKLGLSLAMLIGVGATDTISMVVRGTVRQLSTPDEMRGRMVAVNMLFFAGGPQLGEIEAGVAARLLGGPLSVAAGGLACVVMVGILAALTPQLRKYDGM